MNNYEKVSLETISGGAAKEMFDVELEKVIQNLLDPNIDPVAVREVHLVVKMAPFRDDRSKVQYKIECYAKLGKSIPVASIMYAGVENRSYVAYEHDTKQPNLPFEENDIKSLKIVREASHD